MTISATAPQAVPFGRRVKRFMSDYPIVPLLLLLALLLVALELFTPVRISAFWAANAVKFAIPLALLAGCAAGTRSSMVLERRSRPLGTSGPDAIALPVDDRFRYGVVVGSVVTAEGERGCNGGGVARARWGAGS